MIFKCPLHLFYILLHCARKWARLMWISDEAPTPNQRLCTVTNIVPVETVSTRPSHSTGSGTLSVTTWSCWSPEDEPGLMDLSWRESGNSFSRHVEHVIQHPGCRVCSPLQAPWNSCLIDWFVLFVSLSVCLLSNLNSGLISYCFSFLFPPCIVLMVYLSVCLSCACLISMFEKVKD